MSNFYCIRTRLIWNCLLVILTGLLLLACSAQPKVQWDVVFQKIESGSVDRAAHWVSRDVVLLPPDTIVSNAFLIGSENTTHEAQNPEVFELSKREVPDFVTKKFPHLRSWKAYNLKASSDQVQNLLLGDLVIVTTPASGDVMVHRPQISGVLDDIYTSGFDDADEVEDYGAIIVGSDVRFKLWAPTARIVTLKTYDQALEPVGSYPMDRNRSIGVWSVDIPTSDDPIYYRYQIEIFHPTTLEIETYEVTDPYALCLSPNSTHACVIDLDDPTTQPDGWADQSIRALDYPESQIIYEAHIGDFSANDPTVPENARATYGAFLQQDSAGMSHLSDLVEAGLDTFHILPSYDIGTVNERKGERLSLQSRVDDACAAIENTAEFCKSENPNQTIAELLQSYDPVTDAAQAVIEAIDEEDDYNWGYDPVHYTVPEGSYAQNPDGDARIKEFRAMVQALHNMELRVVMDVVYNHTFQSGLTNKSVLDKVVPGYYHRLNPISGDVERSTCCENTASENVMMGKLMTDSLVVWARDYKIDGFRFDLMGHQPKDLMLKAREAVRGVDPDTYFYGEGWNFGEVENNARFVQATQPELGGTSIGTFSDRLRDAVRGGTPFVEADDMRRAQGIGNGLRVAPNNLNVSAEADVYDNSLDLVRLGLAGNLKDFTLQGRDGETRNGTEITYLGSPAGYAEDPADVINYVSKHDNQTLWDNHQYRLPYTMTTEDRVRLHVQSMSYILYAQGVPFLHMGSEILRSKSFLRDSYNYGHWFNRVDWSLADNNYNVGLPPADKDRANWPLIDALLIANEGRDAPTNQDIIMAKDAVLNMIAIRRSSPLFTLQTSDDIKKRVSFLNTGPEQIDGLIVMQIDDGWSDESLTDLDPENSRLIVVFNHSPNSKTFEVDGVDSLVAHPLTLSDANVTPEGLSVPAFTTAVFVTPE